ncbi:hypothetical protein WN944_029442 [Citrus x changshan-huyou]|uniref:Anthocyanidin 3-O-glucosyltransferase n=1 Tax=Citrus x changshan-huyou TaxID=2935761 RepID=A0AAP0LM26_9ROSI
MLDFGFRYLYGDISRAVGRFLQFHLRTATSMQEATQSSSEEHARLPDNIRVYDVEDGVPMKYASTESNPLEAVELFVKATPENFKKGLDAAVSKTGRKISCFLTDAFLTFSGEMARDMHIPWFPVFVAMPYNGSAHIHTDLIHQFFINSSGSLRLEDQTLDIIPGKLGGVLPQASAAVMNFYQELYCSSQLTNDLNSKFQPLPPPPLPPSDSDETACNGWTDKKQNLLRIISFGTVAIPPEDELIALAEAIGESDVPFLWSLQDDKICVFVTHCGANSVCESIANGVLMICRPFFGDHRMNARMVEEVWGIGVKVEGIVLTKSGVLQSLELMFSHEGKKMRENVRHLKEICDRSCRA